MAKSVKDLQGLAEMFRKAPAHLDRELLRKAIHAGLVPIRDAARANIHRVSGTLAPTLQISVRRTGTGDQLFGTFRTTKEGFYARMVEFGHKWVGHKRAGVRGRWEGRMVPPHPYLAPAWEAGRDEAAAAIEAMVGDLLRATMQDELRKAAS